MFKQEKRCTLSQEQESAIKHLNKEYPVDLQSVSGRKLKQDREELSERSRKEEKVAKEREKMCFIPKSGEHRKNIWWKNIQLGYEELAVKIEELGERIKEEKVAEGKVN